MRGAWLAVGFILASTAAFVQTFGDAVSGGSAQQVLAALKAGANPRERMSGGVTPLMYAARYNTTPAALRALMDSGAAVAPVNQGDPFGITALMLAAESTSNRAAVTALLDAGADRQARSSGGMRAADFALTNQHVRGTAAAAALSGP